MSYNLANDFVDAELEGRVICTALNDEEIFDNHASLLKPEHFAVYPHIWAGLLEGTFDPDAVPSNWGLSTYIDEDAERVVELARLRLLASKIEQACQNLYVDGSDASDIAVRLVRDVQSLERRVVAPSSLVLTGDDLRQEVYAYAERQIELRKASPNDLIGVPSGIPALDGYLGGFVGSRVHYLAGAPGKGKTTLAVQIATHAAATGPVVFVPFENDAVNLALKSICQGSVALGNMNVQDISRGYGDLDKLKAALQSWETISERLTVVRGTRELTLDALESICRDAMLRDGAKRCLVIVDYLQKMASGSTELAAYATAKERIDALTAGIRDLSYTLDSPFLVLASQNRSAGDYSRGKGGAGLDSLKGSGEIEYDADAVMILVNGDIPAQPPALSRELVIAKNRHGATGSIDLIFNPVEGLMREPDTFAHIF